MNPGRPQDFRDFRSGLVFRAYHRSLLSPAETMMANVVKNDGGFGTIFCWRNETRTKKEQVRICLEFLETLQNCRLHE